MNLGEFIDTFKDAIAKRVVESYPPLYRPSECEGNIPHLLRSPLGAQEDAIRGAALSLQAHREPRSWEKWVQGRRSSQQPRLTWRAPEVLVLCPPHLTRK